MAQVHRVAAERDDDRGAQLDAFGLLCGESDGKERIVTRFRRSQPVVTEVLLCLRQLTGAGEFTEESVDFPQLLPT